MQAADSKTEVGLKAWLQLIKGYQLCYAALGQAFKELDLSVAQHDLLAALYRKNGQRQQDLATKLLVVKSNVTALLNRLEMRGLVKREADVEDARVKRVFLTPAGRKMVETSLELQRQIVAEMIRPLSEDEVGQLDNMMRRVRAQLERR